MFYFILFLLAAFLLSGFIIRKLHCASLSSREECLKQKLVNSIEDYPEDFSAQKSELATSSVVLSLDIIMGTFASIKSTLVGGKLGSHIDLLHRARREALMRLIEAHPEATAFYNLRIETTTLGPPGSRRKAYVQVEAFAYATAIY